MSASSDHVKTSIQSLRHATPLSPSNNTQVNSLESFAGTPTAEYTIKKTDVSNALPKGITKISLHKKTDGSSSSTQQDTLITYSIKIYIDEQSSYLIDYLEMNPIFQIRASGNVVKSMFSFNGNVAEVIGLKHEQFILTLGKLMLPDEFIQKLGSIVRTHSNLYNLSQVPTDDPKDVDGIGTPTTPLLLSPDLFLDEEEENEVFPIKQKSVPSLQ